MKNKLVIINQDKRIISAYFEGNEMVQVHIEPEGKDTLLGNIYLGKVKNIVRNINAAFVELSGGIMAYLSISDCQSPIFSNHKNNDKIQIGDEIIVQVQKENIKTKAPYVTTNLNFTGKYAVLTIGKNQLSISSKIKEEEERKRLKSVIKLFKNSDYGIIVRTNAVGVSEEIIKKEIESLIEIYRNLSSFGIHRNCFSLLYQAPTGYICDIRDGYAKTLDEIITDDKELYNELHSYLQNNQSEDLDKLKFYQDDLISLNSLNGINSKLEKALLDKVWLKSGGYLVIQPTEALTVIDVNTGKAIAGKKKVQETFYKVNMDAAYEIAKQIRLRNLSGIIIIDFIDMESNEHKKLLMLELEQLFLKDPIKTVLVDMTMLGLVEVTRKKVRKPLHEQYKGSINL